MNAASPFQTLMTDLGRYAALDLSPDDEGAI